MKTRLTVVVVCAVAVGCGGDQGGTAPDEIADTGGESVITPAHSGWSQSQRIDEGPIEGRWSPDVAVNADGTIMVVWREKFLEAASVIRGRRFIPGLGWEDVANLGFGFDSSLPQVATDGQGRFYATWLGWLQEDPGGVVRVLLSKHEGSEWSTASVGDNTNNTSLSIFEPKICVNRGGIGWIFWTAEYWGDGGVRHGIGAARFDGTTGTIEVRPQPYSQGVLEVTLVDAFVDPDGKGRVATIDDHVRLRVHQLPLPHGEVTSHDVAVRETTSSFIWHAAMARNESGYGAVAYVEWNTSTSTSTLKARRLGPTGPMGESPINVDTTSPPLQIRRVSAAANESGDTGIVWQEGNPWSENITVLASRLGLATGLMGPPQVLHGPSMLGYAVDAQPVPGGHMVATWIETARTPNSTRIWAARWLTDLGWQEPSALETGQEYAWECATGVDAGGKVIAAWAARPNGGEPGKHEIWSARFE